MKTTLALALLSVSFNSVASLTFLGSIKSGFTPTTYSDLKETVRLHAHKKGYLSLGESHLQAKTAIQVNFDLMQTYLNETEKRKSVFCTETLSHFLEPYGDAIKAQVKKYKVLEKNSPHVTDFKTCKDKKKFENYVTYSGFFHQYQFGKPFEMEFPRTAVLTKDGNNIKAQMKGLDGIFVTQMELEYMEYSATRAILNMGIVSPEDFRRKVTHLSYITENLVEKMEEVIKTDDPYTSKKAVVLNAKDFYIDIDGDENSYFVMTNLSYRTIDDSLKALKNLAKLDDVKLMRFLVKIKNSQKRVVSVFLGPFPGGNLGTVTYPGVTRTFKGQSLIMHVRNATEDFLMVQEPDADELICVNYKTSEEFSCF